MEEALIIECLIVIWVDFQVNWYWLKNRRKNKESKLHDSKGFMDKNENIHSYDSIKHRNNLT